MKQLFLLSLIFLVGCSSIQYQKGDEKVSYKRLGSSKISGLNITQDSDGIKKVTVKSSEGDIGQLGEVIADLAEKAAIK